MNLEQEHIADVLYNFLKLTLSLSIEIFSYLDLLRCLIWLSINLLALKIVSSKFPRPIDNSLQVRYVGF